MVLMNQPWPHACLNFHSNKVACAGPTHMVAKILRGHGVVPRVTTEGRARGDERASRAYCYNGEQSTPGHKGNWCLELEVSSHGGNDFFFGGHDCGVGVEGGAVRDHSVAPLQLFSNAPKQQQQQGKGVKGCGVLNLW